MFSNLSADRPSGILAAPHPRPAEENNADLLLLHLSDSVCGTRNRVGTKATEPPIGAHVVHQPNRSLVSVPRILGSAAESLNLEETTPAPRCSSDRISDPLLTAPTISVPLATTRRQIRVFREPSRWNRAGDTCLVPGWRPAERRRERNLGYIARNRVSLWDAMRGRLLIHWSNILKTRYLYQKTRVRWGRPTETLRLPKDSQHCGCLLGR